MSIISELKITIQTQGVEDAIGAKIGPMGELIKRHVPFAVDDSMQLYYYANGRYHPNGEKLVRELYHELLVYWKKLSEWSGKVERELIQYTKVKTSELWDRPPLTRINFQNGVYDLETDLEPFQPNTSDWLSTIQIPVKYNPDAVAQVWPKFLSSILPNGEDFLLQIIGWLMIPHTRMQKAVLLLGEGSNGKGTFLRMVNHIIGTGNVSHMSLHQMEDDRFSRSLIVGKLVNICGDLPVKEINNINLFKALVGEDRIQIEYKGLQPFSYQPFSRLIFSSNCLPKTNDTTEGYRRRWIIIPFSQTFEVSPQIGKDLEDALSSPTELSGLLNLVLPYIPTLIESGFSINPEIAEIISNYAPLPMNVKEYFETHLVEDDAESIPADTLYKHFVSFCRGTPSEEGFTKHGFITYFKNYFPRAEVGKTVRFNGGKPTRCYGGIKFRSNTMPTQALNTSKSHLIC